MDEPVPVSQLNKWDMRFQGLACYISDWSKDPSTKCGAVIVDSKRRIISVGFNGFPRGIEDALPLLQDRGKKYPRILHADENAALFANTSIEGCAIYTWPFMPCSHCAAILIQKGIVKVVAPDNYPKNWMVSTGTSQEMFAEAQVQLVLTSVR